MTQDGPGEPVVMVTYRDEHGGPSRVEVRLRPGQSIVATREPIWFSTGLAAVPHGSATRWEASAEDMLCFSVRAAVARLNLRKAPYAVASDLVILWTDGALFEPFALPGTPGLARASGDGQVWLALPGNEFPVRYTFPNYPPVIAVDPARLAWVRLEAAEPRSVSLAPVAGPGGRTWLQVSGNTKNVRLHGGPRPGQHPMPAARLEDARPADAVPGPAERAW